MMMAPRQLKPHQGHLIKGFYIRGEKMVKLVRRIICVFKGHKNIHIMPYSCEDNEEVMCLKCGRTKKAVIL
jgi:hypothetical protein